MEWQVDSLSLSLSQDLSHHFNSIEVDFSWLWSTAHIPWSVAVIGHVSTAPPLSLNPIDWRWPHTHRFLFCIFYSFVVLNTSVTPLSLPPLLAGPSGQFDRHWPHHCSYDHYRIMSSIHSTLNHDLAYIQRDLIIKVEVFTSFIHSFRDATLKKLKKRPVGYLFSSFTTV